MAYIDAYIPARVPRQKVCMYVSLKDSLLTYIPRVSRPVLGMYVCQYVCFSN